VQINATNNFGVSITNGQFVSEVPLVPALNCCTADAAAVHVLVGPNTTIHFTSEVIYGRASFDNCAFWGGPSQIMLLQPDGGFVLSVSNSVFRNWDRSNFAIDALGGSATITNCEFRNEAPQVRIGPLVQRAVVTGNLMTGPINISVPADLFKTNTAVVANNVGTRGCAVAVGGLDLCGPRGDGPK
jgi:hypothetical protein